MRRWDEAGDEARWLASPARACGTGGGPLDAVVEDGGDVVGVAEPARCGEAREERIDIVMVRFSPAKSSCERAERLGRDGAIGLLSRKPRATDETGPAVLLGCGGDGFGFNSGCGNDNSCIWIILLLFCCGGCGNNNGCGCGGCGGNDCGCC